MIGREREIQMIETCLRAQRNVLIEGPVGVGKTRLASEAASRSKRTIFRIDGDHRYSEQKLTGWFDPQRVLQLGFGFDSFVEGPLIQAMKTGGILFLNELNRMPEGVQNVLLPAIDEGFVAVPRLGEVQASPEFRVIATQNPKEFVATSHLSEAILDRFELLVLDYQSEEEEIAIVESVLGRTSSVVLPAVQLVRLTRESEGVRRGASVRSAIAISKIVDSSGETPEGFPDRFRAAAHAALPTRLELARTTVAESGDATSPHRQLSRRIDQWVDEILNLDLTERDQKKKPKTSPLT